MSGSDTGIRESAYDILDAARQNLLHVLVTFLLGLVGTIIFLRAYAFDKIQVQTLARARSRGYEIEGFEGEVIDTSFINPFEVILLQAKIGIVVGVLLTVPVVVYLARDSLRKRGMWIPPYVSRRSIAMFLVGIFVLFFVGVAYSYFVMIPYIMEFVAAIAVKAEVRPFFRISSFVNFVLIYSVIFGVAAQLPLIMAFTVKSNIVSYRFYREKWKYFVVVGAVVSALVTSPDPMTQLVVLGPLVGIYFLGLGIVRVVARTEIEEQERLHDAMSTTEERKERRKKAGTTDGGSSASALNHTSDTKTRSPPGSATAAGAKAATASAASAGADAVLNRGLIEVAGGVLEDMKEHSKKLGLVFLVVSSVVFTWLIYYGIASIRRQTLSYMPSDLASQVETVQLEIFEFVFLVVKYSAIAGAVATVPFLLYYSRETLISENVIKGDGSVFYYVSRVGVVLGLFLAGAFYAYYGMIPVLVSILSNSIVESGMRATFTIGEFIDFVILVTFLIGVMAEMPAVMYFLVASRVVRYETLKSKWKHFTVGVFVLGAVVTSPDPFTMVVVAVPLSGFYLVALGITRVLCHRTITQVRDERRSLGLAGESD
ncbi:MAG: twin-arginine translocase subunit TatC [Halobacteriales archaeon]|nr:twin-arginine translocase subunit TatC [Halobacteriales archaeon]